MVKGQLKYIPKDVMIEINKLRFEFNIDDEQELIRKLAKRSDMLREIEFGIDMKMRKRK